jgi:hypothetical protein
MSGLLSRDPPSRRTRVTCVRSRLKRRRQDGADAGWELEALGEVVERPPVEDLLVNPGAPVYADAGGTGRAPAADVGLLILRRDDQVGCPGFTPIDAWEARAKS